VKSYAITADIMYKR